MRSDIDNNHDLAIFLLEEDIENLEKGSVLENTLLYKENEEEFKIHVQIKRSKKDKYFIKVTPPVLRNLLEIKSLKISLNKDAIDILKNDKGMIEYEKISIYSPNYEYFKELYNSPKNKSQ